MADSNEATRLDPRLIASCLALVAGFLSMPEKPPKDTPTKAKEPGDRVLAMAFELIPHSSLAAC